jgi:hypothetical protein
MPWLPAFWLSQESLVVFETCTITGRVAGFSGDLGLAVAGLERSTGRAVTSDRRRQPTASLPEEKSCLRGKNPTASADCHAAS